MRMFLGWLRWRVLRPLRKGTPVTAEAAGQTDGEIMWWMRCDRCRKFRVGPTIYHEVYPPEGDTAHGWWYECGECRK